MRLIELLKQATEWSDDEATIYVAQPWSCDAEAILVSPSPDTTEPVEQHGTRYEYFLEAFIARDFVADYEAPAERQCDRLIEYARNDA